MFEPQVEHSEVRFYNLSAKELKEKFQIEMSQYDPKGQIVFSPDGSCVLTITPRTGWFPKETETLVGERLRIAKQLFD